MELIFTLREELNEVSDPRVLKRTHHNLLDILVLSVLAIVSQAETWVDIEDFGRAREEWLRSFLELPNGIPSHDTIGRVFSLINPREFEIAFIRWVNRARAERGVKDVLCIDGKTVSGTVSTNGGGRRDRLSLVNVWSTAQGLVLGQLRSAGSGGSEGIAAKELVELIDVKGLTVVADAGIGVTSFANALVEKKADYIFPLKKNSRLVYDDIKSIFDGVSEKASRSKKVEFHQTSERGHGRQENRYCTIIRKKNFSSSLNDSSFKNLRCVGRIVYESKQKETRPTILSKEGYVSPKSDVRVKKEVRYFVTSLDAGPKKLMETLRLQWRIENQLHWVLDVALGEDGNRTRQKIAAQNLSVVRRIAVNLAKQDKKTKSGIKSRLKRAGWNPRYLEQLLFQTELA